MQLRSGPARSLRARLTVPGDKSVTHRGLWLGALAKGETVLRRPNDGRDCRDLASALVSLGVSVKERRVPAAERGVDTAWTIAGTGGAFTPPSAPLDFGNSGTAARLALGALAGARVTATVDGDASLRRRPMQRVVEPLQAMGARITGPGGTDHLPLTIEGQRLSGREHLLPFASAQVKTALLLAGLAATGVTRVVEPEPSRDHTERLLPLFGARLANGTVAAGRPHAVRVEGPQSLTARDLEVPGDFSAAAFWLVAALVTPDSEITLPAVSLNPTRTGLVPVLQRMGARLVVESEGEAAGEPVGTVAAATSRLKATHIEPHEVQFLIDEIPIWAVAAAAAEGRSRLTGAADLRRKESDRLRGLAGGLGQLGVRVEERPDGLLIEGTGGRAFAGARLDSQRDHRLAMAFLVAGLAAREPLEVTDGEMVDTSYPGFYSTLSSLVSAR
jgi:3-phosphoshikimate 1-carboxyvinyltransferase